MRRALLFSLTVVVALALAFPVSAIATFVLWPVWSWCELHLGIESVGHSAPADWCFFATYSALALPVVGFLSWRAFARSAHGPGSS